MRWQYKIKSETHISESPEVIWSVLTDFPRFDEWNPMLTEMSGEAVFGCQLRFIVTDAKGDKKRMGGKVHEVVPGRRLEWRGGSPFTFIGHHSFDLYPDGEVTRFVHSETYFGLAPLLLRPVLNARAAPLYPAMNEALKQYVEARSWT